MPALKTSNKHHNLANKYLTLNLISYLILSDDNLLKILEHASKSMTYGMHVSITSNKKKHMQDKTHCDYLVQKFLTQLFCPIMLDLFLNFPCVFEARGRSWTVDTSSGLRVVSIYILIKSVGIKLTLHTMALSLNWNNFFTWRNDKQQKLCFYTHLVLA